MAQILQVICKAARASRPGLAVGILRVLCTDMCTAKRVHVDNEEQACRVGCLDESDCLSHYNKCPHPLSFCHNVEERTQILYRSLQLGMVVTGIMDAFVYAHNYHRHNTDNLEKLGDCMEGRIRLLTAITPSYAHTYKTLCLTRRPYDIPCQRIRLPSAKAKYLDLPDNPPRRKRQRL